MEIMFYERCVYESVEGKSLKFDGKKVSGSNGLMRKMTLINN